MAPIATSRTGDISSLRRLQNSHPSATIWYNSLVPRQALASRPAPIVDTTAKGETTTLLITMSVHYLGLVVLLYSFLYHSYQQRLTFNPVLSFQVNDYPGNLQAGCAPTSTGVHYFGDFWSVICHSRLPSPYLADVGSNYLPLTYPLAASWDLVGRILGPLAAIGIASVAMCTALLICCRALVSKNEQAGFIVLLSTPLVLSSVGTLMVFDRGNIQWLVTTILASALYSTARNQPLTAYFLVAVATSLKGYPIVFLIPLFYEWRKSSIRLHGAMIFSGTFTLATLVPLVSFDGSVRDNVTALRIWLAAFNDAEVSTVFYNHSLVGFTRALANITNSSGLHWLADLQKTAVFTALVLLLYVFLSAKLNFSFECNIVFAIFFITTMIPLTVGYVLSISFLILPLTMRLRNSVVRNGCAVCLALLLLPKGFTLPGSGMSLTSLLNGPLNLLILSGFVADSLLRNRRNTYDQKVGRQMSSQLDPDSPVSRP